MSHLKSAGEVNNWVKQDQRDLVFQPDFGAPYFFDVETALIQEGVQGGKINWVMVFGVQFGGRDFPAEAGTFEIELAGPSKEQTGRKPMNVGGAYYEIAAWFKYAADFIAQRRMRLQVLKHFSGHDHIIAGFGKRQRFAEVDIFVNSCFGKDAGGVAIDVVVGPVVCALGLPARGVKFLQDLPVPATEVEDIERFPAGNRDHGLYNGIDDG